MHLRDDIKAETDMRWTVAAGANSTLSNVNPLRHDKVDGTNAQGLDSGPAYAVNGTGATGCR